MDRWAEYNKKYDKEWVLSSQKREYGRLSSS